MKLFSGMIAAIFLMCLIACEKSSLQENVNPGNDSQLTSRNAPMTMQAYYDSVLFTVNMMELSDDAAAKIIAHNQSLNEIYTTSDLDEMGEFFPIIDAIQGDGFNPLWLQVEITFNEGFTPHQFYSDTEVDAAIESGEITLTYTDEVYRCSVIGK